MPPIESTRNFRLAAGTTTRATVHLPILQDQGKCINRPGPSSASRESYMLPSPFDFSMNDGLSRYNILHEIGEGGQAKIHRAIDTLTGRDAVVRELLGTDFSSNSELQLARNLRGVEITNMPRIIEVDAPTGRIVMDLVQGQDLAAIVQQRGTGLKPETATTIIEEVAKALEGLAARGIVHRDIKLSNIMVDLGPNDQVRSVNLIDLGLATPSESSAAKNGRILGTPKYCSLEQFEGKTLTSQSDVYSLGKVFYRILTGHHLFESKNVFEEIDQLKTVRITPDHPLLKDIPAELRSLLARMLSPISAARPTPRQLVTELETYRFEGATTGRLPVVEDIGEARTLPYLESEKTPGDLPWNVRMERTVREVVPQEMTVAQEANTGMVEEPVFPLVNRRTPTVNRGAYVSPAWRSFGVGAVGFGSSLGVGMGTTALLQHYGVADRWAVPAGIATGHGAFLGVTYLAGGKIPSLGAQASGLFKGLGGSMLAGSIYNSTLDNVVGARPDSWARSAPAQVGVSVGGGLAVGSSATLSGAALPFLPFAIANESTRIVYGQERYQSKMSAIDRAKQQMANEWNRDGSVAALVFLGLASVPIFDKLAAYGLDDE